MNIQKILLDIFLKKEIILVMKVHHFFTQEECITSINITPFHYRYLMHITNTRFRGKLTLTIDYLLKKYLAYLYKISISQEKRTLTATYQPRTKEYIIRKISIQPTYWGKLYELRFFLGYSMSFLIRIMLDWEMQEEDIPILPLFFLPRLDDEDQEEHRQINTGNNYSSKHKISHSNLEVFSLFSCPAA